MEIVVAKNILNANEQIAATNRAHFDAARTLVLNMVGSPGGGKTTWLEQILARARDAHRLAVIQGDLATSIDAERIEALGVPAIQINTGQGCHLEARMIAEALPRFDLPNTDILFIENVGNLVCTAGYALGEHLRIVVLSVTEGDDKIAKYPPIFHGADLVLLNKIDLLPFTNFNLDKARTQLQQLRPGLPILTVSARTGEGIDACLDWLARQRQQMRNGPAGTRD